MRFRRPTKGLMLLAALAALAGLLLAATPASVAPGDWWQYGYTAANTRFNPNETTIGPANVGRLAVAARRTPTLGGRNAAHASAVAVANGRAYVQVGDYESGRSALLAYDPGSFATPAAWRHSHQLGIGNGTEDAGNVAATSGAVYVSIYQSTVYGGDDALLSLDAHTGTVRWRVAGIFGSPEVAGGRVFAGASGGQLQARSAATGALLWSRPGGTTTGAPSVTGGMVYAPGTENGAPRLFARRADTGALAWKRALPGMLTGAWRVTVAGASSPAIANGLVFAALDQGLGAWRLSDGVRRWRHGTITYGAPVVSGGRLYVSGSTVAGDQPVTVVEQLALS